ncbi:hypothetical protein FRAAL5441 [Frankia alni ACN14a]|uniref:Uncharacterized protein n=1 Tax=Frankia alni (strain DSM 45986 / CECT 9034 / ACN14a) TaxID=326424 RepID=Q0REN4_FRAAA|nr:hypothetical protein FRAAL5441 [Frankia alni ACN14a]
MTWHEEESLAPFDLDAIHRL